MIAFVLLCAPARAAELFDSGKLLATGGVSQIEGAGGAGLSTWAVISGYGTDRGVAINAHHTFAALDDFTFNATGISAGLFDRVELSYTHQWFDTGKTGGRLGLGNGFTFSQDIVGAKVRLLGDAVYGQDSWLPQIAAGVQYKRASKGPILSAVGAAGNDGMDFYIAATKVLLRQSLLLNVTARLTKANQFGLLGFGNAAAGGGHGLPHKAKQPGLRQGRRRQGALSGLLPQQAFVSDPGRCRSGADRAAGPPAGRLCFRPDGVLR
jgi:hypothetical protein